MELAPSSVECRLLYSGKMHPPLSTMNGLYLYYIIRSVIRDSVDEKVVKYTLQERTDEIYYFN
jgi:hypothetical protein